MQLTAQEKPNILIIMTDELSAESMSFNLGNQYINTPNIDQLAKTGVADARIRGLWENAPTQATDLTAVYWEE